MLDFFLCRNSFDNNRGMSLCEASFEYVVVEAV